MQLEPLYLQGRTLESWVGMTDKQTTRAERREKARLQREAARPASKPGWVY